MAAQVCSPVPSSWSDLLTMLHALLALLHRIWGAVRLAAYTFGTHTCPYLIEHDADFREPVRTLVATNVSAAFVWGFFCFEILPDAEKRRVPVTVLRQLGGIAVLVLQALRRASRRLVRRQVGLVVRWLRRYITSFLLVAVVVCAFHRLTVRSTGPETEPPVRPVRWREVYHLVDVGEKIGAYARPRPCRPIFHVDVDDVWTPLGDICYD